MEMGQRMGQDEAGKGVRGLLRILYLRLRNLDFKYTDYQLKNFKVNSDMMKSVLLGFCLIWFTITLIAMCRMDCLRGKEAGTLMNLLLSRKEIGVFKLEGI